MDFPRPPPVETRMAPPNRVCFRLVQSLQRQLRGTPSRSKVQMRQRRLVKLGNQKRLRPSRIFRLDLLSRSRRKSPNLSEGRLLVLNGVQHPQLLQTAKQPPVR
uniref:Uncharacterized protein n=1 Tax=Cacopsylla melanoneura TaxID=428564 RepID=A0A8D8WKX6_9HEMI